MRSLGRLPLVALLIALGVAPIEAQAPLAMKPASLEWLNLRVVVAPDSDGTWLWVMTGEMGSPGARSFEGTFAPADIAAWVPRAREFVRLSLAAGDTGNSRLSTAVRTSDGGRLYLSRQRSRGGWTDEQLMSLQKADTAEPLIVNGNAVYVSAILDSLEAVNARNHIARPRTDSVARRIDRHVKARRDNRPPPYPQGARAANLEGVVTLAFVVGADGRAELPTVVVIHSPRRDFTKSVLDHLPKLVFEPAMSRGVPVRERVIVPFAFKLYRGPGRGRR